MRKRLRTTALVTLSALADDSVAAYDGSIGSILLEKEKIT